MAPIATPENIKRVLATLRAEGQGLRRAELEARSGLLNVATPQEFRRFLSSLARQGLLHTTGLTRNLRYHFGPAPGRELERQAEDRRQAEGYPPLSPEGQDSRQYLDQPVNQRPPVSYKRAFLDAYLPNQTYYLPPDLRQRLGALGGPQKPEHPAGTYARQILQQLLVDLSWASSHLEGNTYSLLDTERLIALGEAAEGKDLLETQMILNHKLAIEYLVESAESLAPTPGMVQNLHALLMDNLMANPMDPGRLRVAPVLIHGTSYLPLAVPLVLEECFRQILHTAEAILDPYEQSFFLLVHLPYLQPFLDGNKRTARLAANIPFIRGNCIPITFMDVVPEAFTDGMIALYETNRVDLLRDVFAYAYERSCARYGAIRSSLGEPDPFRLQFRTEIKAIVREIVLAGAQDERAARHIQAYAEAALPKEAWGRFRAVVETELASLHEGNFARYQLRPSEFAAWRGRMKE